MESDLINSFNQKVFESIRRSKFEAKYNPTRFIHMVDSHGCLDTAHILINCSTVSEGYTTLWEKGKLNLTIEAIIFDNPEFHPLFTDKEMNMVKKDSWITSMNLL